jgi:nitroreductase
VLNFHSNVFLNYKEPHMSFSELIHQRQSIRAYSAKPVEPDKISRILEAGRSAPSACNIQPLHFIVCVGAEKVQALKTVYEREWFLAAPAVLVVCCDYSKAWVRSADQKNHGDIDAAIAMDHMILAATELGLGTCWIAAFNPIEARRILELPDGIEPVVLTPLGYAAQTSVHRPRKPIDQIVHLHGRW